MNKQIVHGCSRAGSILHHSNNNCSEIAQSFSQIWDDSFPRIKSLGLVVSLPRLRRNTLEMARKISFPFFSCFYIHLYYPSNFVLKYSISHMCFISIFFYISFVPTHPKFLLKMSDFFSLSLSWSFLFHFFFPLELLFLSSSSSLSLSLWTSQSCTLMEHFIIYSQSLAQFKGIFFGITNFHVYAIHCFPCMSFSASLYISIPNSLYIYPGFTVYTVLFFLVFPIYSWLPYFGFFLFLSASLYILISFLLYSLAFYIFLSLFLFFLPLYSSHLSYTFILSFPVCFFFSA